MTNEALKYNILNNLVSNDLLVLQYSDDTYIANSYAKAIAEMKDLEIKYVDTLSDIDSLSNSFADEFCPYLFILHKDTFDDIVPEYSIYENTIVICKKIDKKVNKYISGYVVSLDKLEPWQLEDFVVTVCPTISPQQAKLLVYYCKRDQYNVASVHRLANILDTLQLFDAETQPEILNSLLAQPNTDLYFSTASELVDAIISRDFNKINEILLHRTCCDITPLYVVTILLTKLRYIAIICHGGVDEGKITAQSFLDKNGKVMSDKQFYYYRNTFKAHQNKNVTKFELDRLTRNIEFLSAIDLRLKLGEIELDDDYFLDYIITHVCA